MNQVYLAWISYGDYESDLIGVFTSFETAMAACQKYEEAHKGEPEEMHWHDETTSDNRPMKTADSYYALGYRIYPVRLDEPEGV